MLGWSRCAQSAGSQPAQQLPHVEVAFYEETAGPAGDARKPSKGKQAHPSKVQCGRHAMHSHAMHSLHAGAHVVRDIVLVEPGVHSSHIALTQVVPPALVVAQRKHLGQRGAAGEGGVLRAVGAGPAGTVNVNVCMEDCKKGD